MNANIFSDKVNSVKGGNHKCGVTSLGRDSHGRQVAADRHHATSRNNRSRTIATRNVRPLLEKGKLDNVKHEMRRVKVNILGISEVRWKGAGEFESDGYKVIYSGGEKHEGGVGIILDPDTKKYVKRVWNYSGRILLVILSGKPFDIGIIQLYAPALEYPEEDIELFYKQMDEVLKYLRSQGTKIIMGDFNSKVVEGRIDNIIGPYEVRENNERGEKLVERCKQHELVVTNTWFTNHPQRRWTWTSPGDRVQNQIDFILVQQRFHNSIQCSKINDRCGLQ